MANKDTSKSSKSTTQASEAEARQDVRDEETSAQAGVERSKANQERDTQAERNAAADEFAGSVDDVKNMDPDEEGITVTERERRLAAQGRQATNPLGNP